LPPLPVSLPPVLRICLERGPPYLHRALPGFPRTSEPSPAHPSAARPGSLAGGPCDHPLIPPGGFHLVACASPLGVQCCRPLSPRCQQRGVLPSLISPGPRISPSPERVLPGRPAHRPFEACSAFTRVVGLHTPPPRSPYFRGTLILRMQSEPFSVASHACFRLASVGAGFARVGLAPT